MMFAEVCGFAVKVCMTINFRVHTFPPNCAHARSRSRPERIRTSHAPTLVFQKVAKKSRADNFWEQDAGLQTSSTSLPLIAINDLRGTDASKYTVAERDQRWLLFISLHKMHSLKRRMQLLCCLHG